MGELCCILSKFYIKPQPGRLPGFRYISCILSKFYIKPQQRIRHKIGHSVVSYRNSTSNHNEPRLHFHGFLVVSYRNSTSNHNCILSLGQLRGVVSYRNSTSNHNSRAANTISAGLYLIEILHQTTTEDPS